MFLHVKNVYTHKNQTKLQIIYNAALCLLPQGRSLPLIYTEARGLGGAAPQKLYTIFHQKYKLVTQILVLNNSDQTVKYEEQYSIM